VRLNRPNWLVDYVEEEARKNTNCSGVMERLKAFLDELKAAGESRPEVERDGNDQGEGDQRSKNAGGGAGGGQPSDKQRRTSHQPFEGRRLPTRKPGIPSVNFTQDPGILEEMRGRAAIYRREENVVLLNPHHFKYEDDLSRICQEVGPDSERQALARQLFDEEYCFNAGKFVVLSWLFKGKAEWSERDWEEALSMGALTVHLAAPTSLEEARRKLRQRLIATKLESLGDAR
jgi:hypothetical protein